MTSNPVSEDGVQIRSTPDGSKHLGQRRGQHIVYLIDSLSQLSRSLCKFPYLHSTQLLLRSFGSREKVSQFYSQVSHSFHHFPNTALGTDGPLDFVSHSKFQEVGLRWRDIVPIAFVSTAKLRLPSFITLLSHFISNLYLCLTKFSFVFNKSLDSGLVFKDRDSRVEDDLCFLLLFL